MRSKSPTFVIGFVTIILSLGFGLFLDGTITRNLTKSLTDQYIQQEGSVSSRVAGNLEGEIATKKDDLQLISSFPEVANGSVQECNVKLVDATASISSKIANIGRVGKDGKFICSVNKALIGITAAKLGSYVTQIFNDPNHLPVMSRALIPPGANGYLVAVHIPVFDKSNDFNGTLGGAIYLKDLQDKYLNNVRLAKSGFVVLFDDNGDILYHPDSKLIGKNLDSPEVRKKFTNIVGLQSAVANAKNGNSGTVEYQFEGIKKIAAYRPAKVLANHSWVVLATVPYSDAAAALKDQGVNHAFMLIALTLIFMVLLVAAILITTNIRSVSLQKKLELEKLRAQTLLSSIGDGVIAIDRDWNITHFNQAAADLTGWKIEESVGQPLRKVFKLLREQDRVEALTFIEEVMLYGKTKHLDQKTLLVRKDKSEILIGDSAAPIKVNADIKGAIIIFRSMAEENERNRVKSDFAFASHQFRTPLTQALSAVSLAESATNINDLKDYLKMARTGLESLRILIVKFLDMSTLEGGQLVIKQKVLDARAEVNEIWKMLTTNDPTKDLKLQLNIENNGSLTTDPTLINKILNELLQNALYYSQPKSTVTVTTRTGDNDFIFEIATKGKSIGEDEMPLIFTKFFRASNKPDDVSGSGLGLYLTKEYVKLLNGKIWFTSKDGTTIFYISLPKSDV